MIVVPDDFPSVFENSEAHRKACSLGPVRIVTVRGADDAQELIRRVADAKVIINLRGYVQFTRDVIEKCPDLRMISIWGTGTDNVDLAAARKRGITVCNTAGLNATTAAEHTMALLLAAARNISSVDAAMRNGEWPRDVPKQLHGKTLGLFGMGHVGSRVAKLGLAFGMKVLAFSARGDHARVEALGAIAASKATILAESDFISLHLRLNAETRGFISAPDFACMKPEAILINTARASLVDKAVLVDALSRPQILGAGIDAFHEEPIPAGDPILSLRNTVLSPHIAGQSAEVRRAALLQVVSNVENFLKGAPTYVVVP